MFYLLPNDILFKISLNFENTQDLINYTSINKIIYNFFDNNQFLYWGRNFYSIKFWNKVKNQSRYLSRPLTNMKLELIRLNNFLEFQKIHGHELWQKEDFYLYWDSLEKRNMNYTKIYEISNKLKNSAISIQQ